MAQDIYLGVGMEGSKSMKPTAKSGTPGGVVNPGAQAPKDAEGFGWKALDYKFGDRPLYQVAKGLLKKKSESGGGFCGNKQNPQGGMANPAAKAVLQGGAPAGGSNAALAGALAQSNDYSGALANGTELPAATEIDYSGFA